MDVFATKCPTCSAKIPFDPKTQLWVCDYCGGRFTAEQIKSFEESDKEESNNVNENESTHNYDVEEINRKEEKDNVSYEEELDLYSCSNCGAQIVADKNTSATFCVYCGAYSLIKDRLTGKFAPEYIIPFQTTKEDAKQAYLNHIKTRIFVPDKFKSADRIEKITGVYIPFWTYDSDIRIQKSGTGRKIRTWSSGNYDYTEYSDYEFYRDMVLSFDDVPVDGSEKFEDDLMDSIEPFDYSKKQNFDPRYLSGFLAEKYDVDKEEAHGRAMLRMINTANRQVDNSIPYASPEIKTKYVSENKGEVCYWLLPVWMLNTKYDDKMYKFAMNGVSKKVVGNFPIDKSKILLLFLKLFAIIFVLLFFGDTALKWASETGNSKFIYDYAPLYLIGLLAFLIFLYYKYIYKPNKKEAKK